MPIKKYCNNESYDAYAVALTVSLGIEATCQQSVVVCLIVICD